MRLQRVSAGRALGSDERASKAERERKEITSISTVCGLATRPLPKKRKRRRGRKRNVMRKRGEER